MAQHEIEESFVGRSEFGKLSRRFPLRGEKPHNRCARSLGDCAIVTISKTLECGTNVCPIYKLVKAIFRSDGLRLSALFRRKSLHCARATANQETCGNRPTEHPSGHAATLYSQPELLR